MNNNTAIIGEMKEFVHIAVVLVNKPPKQAYALNTI